MVSASFFLTTAFDFDSLAFSGVLTFEEKSTGCFFMGDIGGVVKIRLFQNAFASSSSSESSTRRRFFCESVSNDDSISIVVF